MAAHVPTMLAMIIASSLMMAASMAVVGWGRRRDGLGRWAAALLVNAIGHLLIMLRGLIPDVLSVVVGNLMLSSVFVGMIAAVYQFQGRPVRRALLLAPPLLALVSGARLVPDPSLGRGDLRVHAESVRIDGTLEARLRGALETVIRKSGSGA